MISLEKLKILTPLQKLPNNVGDLGKLLFPKSNKSPNLVTLIGSYLQCTYSFPTCVSLIMAV